MWPFRKQTVRVDTGSTMQDLITELQALRPIGSKFDYLGRMLVVTGHWKDVAGVHGWRRIPLLSANYADENGVLHSITFNIAEVRSLADT